MNPVSRDDAAVDGDATDTSTTENRSPGGEVHENSWSANLEGPEHAADRTRVCEDAIDAVARTAPGYHVNLVTHGDHGHPADYLYDELASAVGDHADWEYVERCGCGGYVTRVLVTE